MLIPLEKELKDAKKTCFPVVIDVSSYSSIENGIRKVINEFGHKVVTERLFVCPLIAPEYILDNCDPNRSELSYARQHLRGFVATTIGLNPASQDCLMACLMLLSELSTNKENALIIFPNQKSLLSGGRVNKFPTTVGRLFKPSTDKMSAQTLSMIATVENVIEMAEMKVIPESSKLLLLCLMERKVTILITAQKQKGNVEKKLSIVLNEIRSNGDSKDKEKFGISDMMKESIKKSSNNEQYMKENEGQYTTFIATYMQNVMNWNIHAIANHEKYLMDLLKSSTMQEVAIALQINEEYLVRMLESSKMTAESFMKMIPKFVNDLAENPEDKMSVMMKYI